MAKRSKKVSLAPVICCALALVAVIMILLPAFTTKVKLTDATATTGIFEMLGDVFNGESISSLFAADVVMYFLTFIAAIVFMIFVLVSLFSNNKSIANTINILGFIVAILGLVALIFAFIAVSNYNGEALATSMSVNVWLILASVFSIAIPVCNYIIKK